MESLSFEGGTHGIFSDSARNLLVKLTFEIHTAQNYCSTQAKFTSIVILEKTLNPNLLKASDHQLNSSFSFFLIDVHTEISLVGMVNEQRV